MRVLSREENETGDYHLERSYDGQNDLMSAWWAFGRTARLGRISKGASSPGGGCGFTQIVTSGSSEALLACCLYCIGILLYIPSYVAARFESFTVEMG